MSTPEELQEALLNDLLTRVRDGEEAITKSGEAVVVRAPAGVLQAAISYLAKFGAAPRDESADQLSNTIEHYAHKLGLKTVQGGKR